jgi:hypothetical protein
LEAQSQWNALSRRQQKLLISDDSRSSNTNTNNNNTNTNAHTNSNITTTTETESISSNSSDSTTPEYKKTATGIDITPRSSNTPTLTDIPSSSSHLVAVLPRITHLEYAKCGGTFSSAFGVGVGVSGGVGSIAGVGVGVKHSSYKIENSQLLVLLITLKVMKREALGLDLGK